MKDSYLYDNTGIKNINRVLVASHDRAIKDMLYFNPHYYFDSKI